MMNRLMPSARALQPSMRAIQCGSIRTLHTTDVRDKNVRAGKKKISTGGKRMKWLTYEESQPPEMIGVTKSWHSWNTSNLVGEEANTPQTTLEDMLIRRFMQGTWHDLFVSEVIIKRRMNEIILSGFVNQRFAKVTQFYFLTGYTEEILSHFLHRPVKVEVRAVRSAHRLKDFKVI